MFKGKRYEEIKSKKFLDREKLSDYTLIELRTKEIKKFLVLFLYIIDLIFSQSIQIDNQHLQEMCQLCLQEFNSCLFYAKNVNGANDDNEQLCFLSDELVFKLTLIILMTIENLKANKRLNLASSGTTTNSKMATSIYFTSVAFALVFFSHIVNHTIIRLQEALLNLNRKNARPILDENIVEENREKDEIEEIAKETPKLSPEKSPIADKTSKKKLRLIYGLRRRKHNSDSDTNDEEDEDDDDNGSDLSGNGNSDDFNDDDEEGNLTMTILRVSIQV